MAKRNILSCPVCQQKLGVPAHQCGVVTCPQCATKLNADTKWIPQLTIRDANVEAYRDEAKNDRPGPGSSSYKANYLRRVKRLSFFFVCLLLVFVGSGLFKQLKPQKPAVEAPQAQAELPQLAWPEPFNGAKEPLPASGHKTGNVMGSEGAPFQIKSAAGSNYVVKLTDRGAGHYLMIFVRGGEEVNLDVPLGVYTITYASGGPDWYGYRADKKFFGPDTAHFRADGTFSFQVIGDRVHGVSITLYKVPHGNLTTQPIPAEEF